MLWHPEQQGGFDPVTRDAYASWLKSRYGSLEALNDSWHTVGLDWSAAAHPPSKDESAKSEFGLLRTPGQKRAQDWAGFYGSQVPSAINDIAKSIKKAADHRILVGFFYGYALELAFGNFNPQHAGHMGLEEVLSSPDIDFVGSPYSYNFSSRAFGLPMDVMGLADSAALHGKLYFLEDDTFTHLAEKPSKELMAPGYGEHTHNMKETMAALKRNLGTCLAHGFILHWDNLLSDGRFDAPEIWKSFDNLGGWKLSREQTRGPYQPQVAMVVDEKAYFSLSTISRSYSTRWLDQLRAVFSRLGTTVGYYLQDDLASIPDSVRCIILPTSFTLSPVQIEELRQRRLKDGRMVVFCWMPPGASGAKPGEALRTIPGLEISVHPECKDTASTSDPSSLWSKWRGKTFDQGVDMALLSARERGDDESITDIWDDEGRLAKPYEGAHFGNIAPYATVVEGKGDPLARYVAGGDISCAWKRESGSSVVFLGSLPTLPGQWRVLLEQAGCHFYLDDLSEDWDWPDVVQADDGFLMIQSGSSGTRTVKWPAACDHIFHWNGEKWQEAGKTTAKLTWTFERGVPEFFRGESRQRSQK